MVTRDSPASRNSEFVGLVLKRTPQRPGIFFHQILVQAAYSSLWGVIHDGQALVLGAAQTQMTKTNLGVWD